MEFSRGSVALIGAGPGDPELITIKAIKYLEKATVVLTDRLASTEILKRYCSSAHIIEVGKNGITGEKTHQQVIDELLCKYAFQQERVVRLKGGDATLFSNITSEINALRNANIPFIIIPGITAASGAAAQYQFPLTTREYAHGLRYLTLCSPENWTSINWDDLIQCSDTLVFYMTGKLFKKLIVKLIECGTDGDKPIAIIEKATMKNSKIHLSAIAQSLSAWENLQPESPSIVIVGNILHFSKGYNVNVEALGQYALPNFN
jgi:uroporphyrin-III C-methyltransferase